MTMSARSESSSTSSTRAPATDHHPVTVSRHPLPVPGLRHVVYRLQTLTVRRPVCPRSPRRYDSVVDRSGESKIGGGGTRRPVVVTTSIRTHQQRDRPILRASVIRWRLPPQTIQYENPSHRQSSEDRSGPCTSQAVTTPRRTVGAYSHAPPFRDSRHARRSILATTSCDPVDTPRARERFCNYSYG